MLSLFKKKLKEPNYTVEGECLYNLLSKRDNWILKKDPVVYSSSITGSYTVLTPCIYHEASQLMIRYNSYPTNQLCVKIEESDTNPEIFNEDDNKRLVPLVNEMIKFLRDKPIRDRLLKFSKKEQDCSKACSE